MNGFNTKTGLLGGGYDISRGRDLQNYLDVNMKHGYAWYDSSVWHIPTRWPCWWRWWWAILNSCTIIQVLWYLIKINRDSPLASKRPSLHSYLHGQFYIHIDIDIGIDIDKESPNCFFEEFVFIPIVAIKYSDALHQGFAAQFLTPAFDGVKVRCPLRSAPVSPEEKSFRRCFVHWACYLGFISHTNCCCASPLHG